MTLTFGCVGIFIGINTQIINISLFFQRLERLFDSGPGTRVFMRLSADFDTLHNPRVPQGVPLFS